MGAKRSKIYLFLAKTQSVSATISSHLTYKDFVMMISLWFDGKISYFSEGKFDLHKMLRKKFENLVKCHPENKNWKMWKTLIFYNL